MSDRWLYGWGLGSVALGGASLVVPLYAVDLGGGPFVLGLLAAVAALVGVPGALGAGRIADRTGNYRLLLVGTLVLIAGAIAVIPLLESVTPVILANGVLWFAFAAATPVVTLLAVVDAPAEAWSERIALLNKYQGIGWAVGLFVGSVWTGFGTRLLAPELVIRSLFVPLAVAAALGLLWSGRTLPADPPAQQRISGDRLRRALQRANRFSVRSATFPFTVSRADFREFHPRRFVDRFSPTLALYFLAVCLCFAGFAAFFAPLPAFLADAGYGSDGIFALYLINSLAAAAVFGPTGRLSAKWGAELVQIVGLSVRSLAFSLVVVVDLALGATAFGFGIAAAVFALIGVTWAIIAVTASTLVTELAPVTIRGEALGMYAALSALAGGVGSLLGGWLAAGSYLVAFGAAGGLVFGGAVTVVFVRRRTVVDRNTARTPA
ncbi:MAG: MFS transporter [Euryarchaeota archaeon]|nr:MFS transporter [Euryarchaeota archaeon]